MKIVKSIAHLFSGKNRKKKYELFLSKFKPTPGTKILDVGFSDIEYSPNDNYLEKHFQFPNSITALGIDEPKSFSERYPKVNVIKYDGNNFPFGDREFNIGWSNAVIEHVGDYNKQILFLKEIERTCGSFFITTPNRYFPVEIHTRIPLLHYLPKKYFDLLLTFIGKKWATGSYMNLLSEKNIIKLLERAKIENYQIIKNKIGIFTLDFVIIVIR